MNKSNFLIWLISIIITFKIWFTSSSYLYTILFLFTTYSFFSISEIKDKYKLCRFNKIADIYSKYYFSIFAVFSAYLFLSKQSIPNIDLSYFIILWYILLSVFLLFIEIVPTGFSLYNNINSFIARGWFLIIIFIFGGYFAKISAILNVGLLGLDLNKDLIIFKWISFLELIILLVYIFYFYKIDFRIK